MSRRHAALVVGTAAALAILALVWWLVTGRREPAAGPGEPAAAEAPRAGEKVAAELYFPAGDGHLGVESRELPAAATPEERAGQVVTALLEGPVDPAHFPTLREAAVLTAVHLSRDGVLYVDLGSPELSAPPVAGSHWEILTVYSLVNSILHNVPEASAVALLWNGHQRPTFAGHIDTSHPLTADGRWLGRR